MTISRTSDRGHFSSSPTLPVGSIMPYAASTTILNAAPLQNWLLCSGAAVNRTTFGSLFGCLVPLMGNPTITIASPAVVTLNNHGLVAGNTVYFTTTGSLPAGIIANTLYYVISAGLTTNAFEITTINSGEAVNTSGTQSGTHSLWFCPYGLGDGSTTFNVPDMRGIVPAGLDNIGGTAASRINLAANNGQAIGGSGGEQQHTLIIAEMPSHQHVGSTTGAAWEKFVGSGGVLAAQASGATYAFGDITTNAAGGGGAHNNLQPYILLNWIIKAI